MKNCANYMTFLVILLTISPVVNAESMLDWIWGKSEKSSTILITDGTPLISIPYEMLTEDEKFLKEAAKFVTDIQISSPLEICQHKVVLQIKTSCSSMTEEQLAKLSVNLLNCQSAAEGRKVFTCTDEMFIKQCTTDMDPDTWNAYHLMSNRARAVCYAARSHQFRALTELTVNKLMESAHSQIKTLSSLKESQNRLEEKTVTANKIMESNIQDLNNEKALIRAGHIQLANMTEDIKKKLEKASEKLLAQSSEQNQNHKEILNDLENIKIQAQLLWEKIEINTNHIIEQNYEAANQYEETLMKLEKINQTIVFVWDLINTMHTELDKKLGWITEYIGNTGENLEKIYRITLHIVYLLGAMLVASFLQAPFLTRTSILGVVPLNLLSYLKHGFNASLDFISLSVLILLITAMHYVMNGIHYMLRSNIETTTTNHKSQHLDDGTKTPSLWFRITLAVINIWNFTNRQIIQSIENLKTFYSLMKSWVREKCVPTEELSCSYLPKKNGERIISTRGYPSMSDDSSEFSDSPDIGRYAISDDKSMTGVVLRRNIGPRNATPLTAFFKGNRESNIRETMHVPQTKEASSRSVTPVTRALCGARTRSGNPCRLMSTRGQNFCHKHASGSSTMGD